MLENENDFLGKIGPCNIVTVELRALREGLQLAWSKGFSQLCVENDSRVIVNLSERTFNPFHPNGSLIQETPVDCQGVSWIKLRYVNKDANTCTNRLAKLGHFNDYVVTICEDPSVEFLTLLNNDCKDYV